MSGIAGIIGTDRVPDASKRLDLMLTSMSHHPFYTSGKEIFADEKCACGWVSRKGTFSDCMPVWNESKDICLVFSGEDFTDAKELDFLKSHGHAFNPANAEYLVHLYEEHGLDFLSKLNAWFCGLLVDLRKKKAWLFNDRYGIGRVYWHEADGTIYFASEAKALLRICPNLRKLDPRSLGEFFSLGSILQDRTFFPSISLLPGGSLWTFGNGRLESRKRFFEPAMWEQQERLPLKTYYDLVRQTWERLLPRYLRGNQPVALSLTGGVDSRMILAWGAGRIRELACYTFGGRYRDCADVKISREIARICRQPHHTLPISADFLDQFPQLAEKTVWLSDGCMDVSGTIDLYIQRLARQIAPVRVTGTNGGEIMRSLVAFKPMPLNQNIFNQEFVPFLNKAAETYREELRGNRLTFTAFKQAPWYMNSKFVVERSEVSLRMPYFDNELVSLVYQAPEEAMDSNALSLQLIADGNPALAGIGTDRGVRHSPIPGITRARHMFQEFTFKAEYAYDYGMPQWLAKIDHAFSWAHLERLFLGRHKFHHFRVFYRDELSGFIKDVLLSPAAATRNYLSRPAVERIVNGHVKGDSNYTLELHKLLSAELIHRTLLAAN